MYGRGRGGWDHPVNGSRNRGSRERRELHMRHMIGSFGHIATDGRRRAQGVKAAVALAIVLAVGVAAGADAASSLNGRISFTSFRDGGLGDVWTMNPDGTHLRKLTEGPLYDAQSDWSPDGQWIAFRRGPNASQRLGVWKMDLYGGAQTLLAQGDPAVPAQNATQPAWSPDGQGLLFRASLPPFSDSDIWWMDTNGNGRHLVAHIAGEQLYPSYSPDMSTIAFTTALTSTDRAIVTMAADGSRLSTVFDVPGAYDSAPAWSPDGEQIAFESDQDGDMEIYVMNVDGSDVRQMTDNTIHDEGPVWSPDGKRITFTSGPGDLDGDRACGDVTHAGSGAYSVVATGRGLDCATAHAVAKRWSESALAGAADATVKGFICATTDAGYDALKVACTHRGNRAHRPQRRGNRKSIAFI